MRKIINILNEVNFNQRHYDITGSLFEKFLSERARGGTTNDLGQYFTPKNIISLLYTLSGYEKNMTVYDPYCGTGGILVEFFLENTNSLSAEDKNNFGKKYLYGSEITPAVSMLAKMNMILVGDGHSNIEEVDSLSSENKYVHENTQFDIVATNIPFAPITPQDAPQEYLKMSSTSSSLSHFIEHCINRCKVGGRIVLIAPKGFLTEKQSSEFKR